MKKLLVMTLITMPLIANATIKDDDWYNSGRLDIDYGNARGQNQTGIDGQWRIGDDFNKFVIEFERTREGDEWDDAEVQLLYSRYLGKYWDWRTGIRQGLNSDGETSLMLGIEGLAPYWFETEASIYLDQDGDFSVETELSYELQLTQNLVAEIFSNTTWYTSDKLNEMQGRGLVSNDIGLGLRYEFNRHFALYVEGYKNQYHGKTATIRQLNGLATREQGLRVGIRLFNIIF